VLDELLADADWGRQGLGRRLRETFFEQHAKRFHHRPFIWHVWDCRRDGFAALVNYHRLDAKNLERLIHT
jgi:aromatic ring-cleaving dioxygenase